MNLKGKSSFKYCKCACSHFPVSLPVFGRREQWWIRCLCAAMWEISTPVFQVQTWSTPSAQPAITYWPCTKKHQVNTRSQSSRNMELIFSINASMKCIQVFFWREGNTASCIFSDRQMCNLLTTQQTDVRGLLQEISFRHSPASRSHKQSLPSFDELIWKRKGKLIRIP